MSPRIHAKPWARKNRRSRISTVLAGWLLTGRDMVHEAQPTLRLPGRTYRPSLPVSRYSIGLGPFPLDSFERRNLCGFIGGWRMLIYAGSVTTLKRCEAYVITCWQLSLGQSRPASRYRIQNKNGWVAARPISPSSKHPFPTSSLRPLLQTRRIQIDDSVPT